MHLPKALGPAALCAMVCAGALSAGSVDISPRPESRAVVTLASSGTTAVMRSPRPAARPDATSASARPADTAAFHDWVTDFRPRALAQGIDAAVFDRAFQGIEPDPKVIDRDRNQSEFSKAIWDYLDSAVSDSRITGGRSGLRDHAATLAAIEARYGVEKEIVVAIWGLESAFGAVRGSDSVMRSMATLAHDGRRKAFFEEQLIAALRILQSGDTTPANMRGSWAGAMGHTQFMPTSYLAHAVDFTGDGRRDIWSDDPTDALASTAAYLAHFGWTKGQPWGVEVRLPDGFDFRLARRDLEKLPSAWARLGVRDMDGTAVPDHGPASVLLPAGGDGVAFLIFRNFEVIERYNTADAYVIGVGHLADRIAGAGPFRGDWPRSDRALSLGERKELQERLTGAGFDTQGVDGRIGPLTVDAVRAYQVAHGLMPDGYASLRLLERLR